VATSVDVIVAAIQLSEIQSLIKAIRAADVQSAAFAASSSNRCPSACRPSVPAARFEPRPVIHPTPRYLPRPVIHPTPRIEKSIVERDRHCTPVAPTVVVQAPTELPLQPPWKTVPWQTPPPPAPKVKLACYHPDKIHRGMLLDFFI
jgi:hypothetical protein